MSKRILVPTDFSKNALNAARYAQHLYKAVNCEFHFLNVFQVDGYALDTMVMVPEPGEPAYEAAKRDSEEGLERLLEQLQLDPDNSKHTYYTTSTFNAVTEAVKHAVAKKDIDIVVMGTKGRTRSKSVFYGTNTVSVMEELTECPVMAVPEEARFSPPKEIVFPTDFKTVFKHKELHYLLDIAKMHHSSLRVLYVNDGDGLDQGQEENKVLLGTIFSETDHSFHTLNNVRLGEGINAFVESRGCDMIAFINRKHHFFASIFKKPLIKELGFHARIPVLELNDRS